MELLIASREARKGEKNKGLQAQISQKGEGEGNNYSKDHDRTNGVRLAGGSEKSASCLREKNKEEKN